jgi:hypothetical protein
MLPCSNQIFSRGHTRKYHFEVMEQTAAICRTLLPIHANTHIILFLGTQIIGGRGEGIREAEYLNILPY